MTTTGRTRFWPLLVTAIERLTPDAVAVTLQPPAEAAALFRFTAGQYLTFRRSIEGEEVRRSYSICADPEEGVLRVGIKRVPGGRFSSWANDKLAPGETLESLPPEGSFTFEPDPARARTVLALAAGSGITPVLAIATALLEREPGSNLVLLYGNRTRDDIMFKSALEDLKDRHLGRFALVHLLSREACELPILHGRIDRAHLEALLPRLAPPATIDAAYICGPAGLPEEASAALRAMGVPGERIFVERFTPAEGASPARPVVPVAGEAPSVATVRVTLDGITREIGMAEGETVLEAVLRAGIDAPWSCRAGMCCTCRAKLGEGEVAMDQNYSLRDWELAAGYVLTCQSRPKSERLAVDYDAA
ncbi:MAG: 2Fe-2S iron-sulfur cluster-binding protein [Geminicoccaceae bacterium]|nr:2Fe-2S iron-sulfur cluster-binding protein [Geminicoccaceae bacterium]MCX8101996.1 2Fe-2S iron-sulfur cluster-binding protein [Geminicoccaceae bacterium]MDW8369321.1 2Fe-2S iron-sulfur cluster-binding protein [Geminicoccaceae bacterium]